MRAVRRIGRDIAGRAERCHRDGKARAIERFAIAVHIVITGRFHVYRAEAAAAIFGRSLELGHIAPDVKVGIEAIAVVRHVEVAEAIQGLEIARPMIVDIIRATKNADAGDIGIEGHANTTKAVVLGGDQTRDGGAVSVIRR